MFAVIAPLLEMLGENAFNKIRIEQSGGRKAASLSSAASRIGCEGRITLPTLANSAAICKNRAGAVGTCDRTNCVV
jgi:hypothetical protein